MEKISYLVNGKLRSSHIRILKLLVDGESLRKSRRGDGYIVGSVWFYPIWVDDLFELKLIDTDLTVTPKGIKASTQIPAKSKRASLKA